MAPPSTWGDDLVVGSREWRDGEDDRAMAAEDEPSRRRPYDPHRRGRAGDGSNPAREMPAASVVSYGSCRIRPAWSELRRAGNDVPVRPDDGLAMRPEVAGWLRAPLRAEVVDLAATLASTSDS